MGTLLKGAAERANDNYGEAQFVATVMEDLKFRPCSKYCGDTVLLTPRTAMFIPLYPLDSVSLCSHASVKEIVDP